MVKRTWEELEQYAAAGHHGMTAMRIAGKQETGNEKFWVGLSTFLPGGGAEWGASPAEKVYYVLSGEMTIYTKEDKSEKLVLKANDTISILGDEYREMLNESNSACTLLVIVNYP